MYTIKSRVRYSETDIYGNLSVTGMLNYMQDCSTMQSEDLGIGIDFLKKEKKAWWLSSWQVVIDRYPKLGEYITIGTAAYDYKGLFAYRNFAICDDTGSYLAKANSVWFYYDLAAERPVRILPEYVEKYMTDPEPKLDMEYADRKIILPEKYEVCDGFHVAKFQLDTNKHVNNAQYIEMARELIPDNFRLSELRADYKKAAMLSDAIVPHRSVDETGYTIVLCDASGGEYAAVKLIGKE